MPKPPPGPDALPQPSLGPRCFVALWPDEAAGSRLDALAARLHAAHPGARRMRRENLHLTLAFIGALDSPRQVQVVQALAGIAVTPSDWRIDRIGAFAAARVLWAGSATAAAVLAALAADVRHALDALGVGYDRKPFAPHVTLLRNLPRAAPPDAAAAAISMSIDPPITWRLQQPLLLRSDRTPQGLRYREVAAA